jgi:hypothetical protein
LANGNYDLSFYFIIPQDAPSSVYWKDKHHEAKPSVNTQYEIKAKLDVAFGGKDFKYK